MLTLQGVFYTKAALLQKADEPHSTPWEVSFWNFIKTWLNEEEIVAVNTSGSTGTPKIIQLEKKRMVESAKATGAYFDLNHHVNALLCLPCDYIAGKMMVVRAFVLGMPLWIVEPSSRPLAHLDKTIPLGFAAMIPLQVIQSLEEDYEQFNQIEKVIIGGGVVDQNLTDRLQKTANQCFATYGMTETITHIAIKKLNGKDRSSYYNALKGVKFSQDERQCLVIEAPRLSTDKIITNDMIRLISPTTFEWLGRVDNVINSGGIKLNPELIEAKLERILSNPFFVGALPDEKLGQRIILVVESKQEVNEGYEELSSVLSKFEMPKAVYFLPEFIRTPTGKIQRSKTINTILSL